eukprot:IDg10842t1
MIDKTSRYSRSEAHIFKLVTTLSFFRALDDGSNVLCSDVLELTGSCPHDSTTSELESRQQHQYTNESQKL